MKPASHFKGDLTQKTSLGFRQGYSYIELLLAVTITGIGICTLMAGLQWGLGFSHTSGSMELSRIFADAIRQFTLDLEFEDPDGGGSFGPEEGSVASFDDIDDLNGLVQTPPIGGDGLKLVSFEGWTQKVRVNSIDPQTLTAAANGTTDLIQLTIEIERGGKIMGVYQWLISNR